MTTNNMTILYENSAPEEYAALLKGRYVTDITIGDDEMSATITLDNGTVLDIHGSCECSCGNGWTYMREAFYARKQQGAHHERPRRNNPRRRTLL